MSRKFIASFLISVAIIACHPSKDDLSGDGTLSGRLVYTDLYQGNGVALPLTGKSVKIAVAPSDMINYLYAINSDSAGYFSFTGLNKNKTYVIFYRDSTSGHQVAASYGPAKPGVNNIVLTASADSTNQSVLHFTAVDSSGGPVGNAQLCIFNSSSLFHADTACKGSVFQLITDAYGRATLYNIQPGSYFFRAVITVNNKTLIGLDSAPVKATPPTDEIIKLFLQKPPPPVNGFAFKVITADSTPFPNCAVYVFNNKTLFDADTTAGSIFQLLTDINGQTALNNQTPGWYYFLATAKVGNLSFKGQDSVQLPASGQITRTILVK